MPNSVSHPHTIQNFSAPICEKLLFYWRTKSSWKDCPAWSDIDLMEIKEIAPFITVCDAVDGGAEFVARYFGTGIVEIFGFDRTGKCVSDGYPAEKVEMIVNRYRLPFTTGEPARVVGHLTAVGKDYPLSFEAIYLPLRGKSGAIEHVISAYDFSYDLQPEDDEIIFD